MPPEDFRFQEHSCGCWMGSLLSDQLHCLFWILHASFLLGQKAMIPYHHLPWFSFQSVDWLRPLGGWDTFYNFLRVSSLYKPLKWYSFHYFLFKESFCFFTASIGMRLQESSFTTGSSFECLDEPPLWTPPQCWFLAYCAAVSLAPFLGSPRVVQRTSRDKGLQM